MQPVPSPRRLVPAITVAAWLACAGTAAHAQEKTPAPGGQSPGAATPARDAPAPAPAPAPGPDKPAATAVDAAKDYTRLMSSNEPASAVRTYWDMDGMLSGIFGEHLRRQTDDERAEMKRLLLSFIENVYANPAIAAAMKQAAFADFQEHPGPAAGTTAVAFNVRIQDKTLPNSLHMKQVDGNWKIFDAGTSGRMMVSAIRSQYEPQAQRVTPLNYIKAMLTEVPGAKKEPVGPRREQQGAPRGGQQSPPEGGQQSGSQERTRGQ